MQSRKASFVEAFIKTFANLLFSIVNAVLLARAAMYPAEAVRDTYLILMFIATNLFFAYAVRRFFNELSTEVAESVDEHAEGHGV